MKVRLNISDREFDAFWERELSRYCPRCDRLWYKCDCAEMDDRLSDREAAMGFYEDDWP